MPRAQPLFFHRPFCRWMPLSYDLGSVPCLMLLQSLVLLCCYTQIHTRGFPLRKGFCTLSNLYTIQPVQADIPDSESAFKERKKDLPAGSNSTTSGEMLCVIWSHFNPVGSDGGRVDAVTGPVTQATYISETMQDGLKAQAFCREAAGDTVPCCGFHDWPTFLYQPKNCHAATAAVRFIAKLSVVYGLINLVLVVFIQCYLGWVSKGQAEGNRDRGKAASTFNLTGICMGVLLLSNCLLSLWATHAGSLIMLSISLFLGFFFFVGQVILVMCACTCVLSLSLQS